MGLKRNETSVGAPLPTLPDGSGGAWEKAYPNVVEFLAMQAWPDGTARSTGTVMLMVEGGRWKCWVHDRDASLGAFVSAADLTALLKSLNTGLESGGLDWRPDNKVKRK